jgi:hypothetical protein
LGGKQGGTVVAARGDRCYRRDDLDSLDLYQIGSSDNLVKSINPEAAIAFRVYQNPMSRTGLPWILDVGDSHRKIFLRDWILIPGCTGLRGRSDRRAGKWGDPEAWFEGTGFVDIDEYNAQGIITLE